MIPLGEISCGEFDAKNIVESARFIIKPRKREMVHGAL